MDGAANFIEAVTAVLCGSASVEQRAEVLRLAAVAGVDLATVAPEPSPRYDRAA